MGRLVLPPPYQKQIFFYVDFAGFQVAAAAEGVVFGFEDLDGADI